MGRPHLTRRRRAVLGYVAFCLVAVAGVYVIKGLGVALIVAGVIGAASFLLLADVDEEVKVEPPAVNVPWPQRFHDPTL